MEQLILEHKDTMSTMLAMVKDKMMLVNSADANLEGLQDYVLQLNSIHDHQLSMIASLWEHLLAYHLAQSECSSYSQDEHDDGDAYDADVVIDDNNDEYNDYHDFDDAVDQHSPSACSASPLQNESFEDLHD